MLALDHLTTLATGNNLARAYQSVGRAADGITFSQEVLPGFKKAFGPGSGTYNAVTVPAPRQAAQGGVANGRAGISRSIVMSRKSFRFRSGSRADSVRKPSRSR